MEYKRIIQFRYFCVFYREKDVDNDRWGDYKAYDLVKWIMKMDEHEMLKKSIRFNNILARIECFSHSDDDDLWGMRLLKLRDTNIPTKVKENEESEPVELDDDEYLGEDITILYEKCSSILMIQMNRFSLGITKLEEFFNYTSDDENIEIAIKPIVELDRLDKLNDRSYRNIEISFANLGRWQDNDNHRSLASIIKPVKAVGGFTGSVKIGLGHFKNTTLNKPEIKELIKEVLNNKEFVKSAKVRVSDDDEKGVEVIDLFEDVYHDFIQFTLPSKTALNYSDAIISMRYCFKERRPSLCKAIGYVD